jgi:hypothetical protein
VRAPVSHSRAGLDNSEIVGSTPRASFVEPPEAAGVHLAGACLSVPSGLETRGLHPLMGKKAIDGLAMNAQHAANPHGIEPSVVNQAPDRLRMDAQLVRHFTNTDEGRISTC